MKYLMPTTVRVIGRMDAASVVSGADGNGWVQIVIHGSRSFESWPSWLLAADEHTTRCKRCMP